MTKNKLLKIGFVHGIVLLFIVSALIPITLGYNVKTKNDVLSIEKKNFDRYLYPKYYNCYNASEIPNHHITTNTVEEISYYNDIKSTTVNNPLRPSKPSDGPMDSSWPLYCHDVRHTGQSPYSTVDTTGEEKWRIKLKNWVEGSPVIDENGIIYVGCGDFFAVYPNGTIKWNYSVAGFIWSAPAIDENGVIYVGSVTAMPNYLYAFYPDGTLKWKYVTGDSVYSSPVIGNDGTIYFGQRSGETGFIKALYPNGTLRWEYHTDGVVYSSPAIGSDGTVYCGSHDQGLYALYPNNGTVKWRFGTGGWVRTAPCIADDGTIYCVSLSNYLFAINPNGTMKWRTDVGAGTSPTIGQDGTVYAGWSDLYAVNPTNGSVKWVFDPGPGRVIEGGTPAHSADGTIYCGVCIGNDEGGEIIAINSNGTEKWRKTIADWRVESAPAIAEDGTVYIGSTWEPSEGFLHAFGPLDSNAPIAPTITGQTNGKIKTTYTYTFTSTSPIENKIYYLIDWGDSNIEDWIGPYVSGETVTVSHAWISQGTYTISARAKDTDNLWGPWGTLSVTMPLDLQISQRNSQQISQQSSSQLLLKMLQKLLLNIR